MIFALISAAAAQSTLPSLTSSALPALASTATSPGDSSTTILSMNEADFYTKWSGTFGNPTSQNCGTAALARCIEYCFQSITATPSKNTQFSNAYRVKMVSVNAGKPLTGIAECTCDTVKIEGDSQPLVGQLTGSLPIRGIVSPTFGMELNSATNALTIEYRNFTSDPFCAITLQKTAQGDAKSSAVTTGATSFLFTALLFAMAL
jgi:hypothetical protein